MYLYVVIKSALLFIMRDSTLQIHVDTLFLCVRRDVVLAGNKMNDLFVLSPLNWANFFTNIPHLF